MAVREHPVLLFDGVCHLCHSTVHFILRNDPNGIFQFAPLQSEIARQLLSEAGYHQPLPDGVILIDQGNIYLESDASLRVLFLLGGWWKLPALLRFVPRFIRQAVYRLIARNRYSWFGKYDACPMPQPGWKSRFLDQNNS